MTAADLIKGSLRLIGAIATGETPSADEQSDALVVLNDMLESWSIDGLLVYQRVRENFALVPSQQTYTMGVSGNFNTSRPTRIVEAGIEINGNEIPVYIMNEQEWRDIGIKSLQSTIPQRLYTDGSYPLENVNLWPIPSAANNLILYSLKPLTSFTSTSNTVSLPPGYSRALRYNLALELAPEFGKAPSVVIASIASESKADIKRQNTQPVYMKSDAFGLVSRKPFNWFTGE